ncbi:DUF4386 domain-containing protein [Ekhidna sp. MALMAid0563]|uniref:DUF4386 domain-containing protein n=1 Tax=Ekhidna sp. MALMAid0563 TaxID=3143937 RepID=UPI0032E02E41
MHTLPQQKNAVKWLRILYPLWAVLGMFSLLYVPSQLIVLSDPELTASNILTDEMLFRLGIAGSLITQLFSVAAVWFLYKLFYDAYKDAVLLMAIFAFLGVPIAMLSTADQLMVLEVLDQPDQVVSLLKQSSSGTIIATIFWGLWLLPQGYMIISSPLFPRVIGWFMILAGAGYTISAFAYFLGIKGILIDVLDYLTFGEVIWMLWVLIMGARWKALN